MGAKVVEGGASVRFSYGLEAMLPPWLLPAPLILEADLPNRRFESIQDVAPVGNRVLLWSSSPASCRSVFGQSRPKSSWRLRANFELWSGLCRLPKADAVNVSLKGRDGWWVADVYRQAKNFVATITIWQKECLW